MPEEIMMLGNVPKPGEPLQPKTDEQNELLLQRDLASRIELLKAKLEGRELRRVKRRYKQLHTYLNRRGYNKLVTQRAEVYERFVMARAAYKTSPTAKLKREVEALADQGRRLNAQIFKLSEAADEFDKVADRLRAHEAVIAFEKEDRENREAFYREADVWLAQIESVFRQSPKLHHVYKDRDGRERIVLPIIKQAILQEDKIHFQIKITNQNIFQKWLGVWQNVLPYGVNVRDLISDETLENLSAACGRVVTYERSKASQNIFYVVSRLDSADGIPNKVLHSHVMDFYPQERHSETVWPGGVTHDRKIIWFSFEEYHHVLIGGASGGGKSNLLNQMLCTLITMNTPDELRLVLIDNKGGIEFTSYENIPHLLMPMIRRVEDVIPALEYLRKEMEQRLAAFQGVARDFVTFNKRVKKPIPRLLILVDEMATLAASKQFEEIQSLLLVISSQGRAVGMNMILCTQHPSVDVIKGWVKTNFTLRIAFPMPNHTASQIVIDSISAAHLPDVPGRAIFRRGGFEVPAQTPYIDDSAIARAVTFTIERFPPATAQTTAAETSDDAPFKPPLPEAPPPLEAAPRFSVDDLLTIAIDEFKGKLSASRTHNKVGNEVMSLYNLRKMVDSLVKDIQKQGGVLEWRGERFQLSKDRNAHLLVRLTEYSTEEKEPPDNETPIDSVENHDSIGEEYADRPSDRADDSVRDSLPVLSMAMAHVDELSRLEEEGEE